MNAHAMREHDLPAVLALEQHAHAHPWTLRNFSDSLSAGHACRVYWPTQPATNVLGYWVAMVGVQESHLLNLTVAPQHRRQGHARRMLRDMLEWSRQCAAAQVWLEVRQSNRAARALYEDAGFVQISVRKAYYPLHDRRREDAVVMCLSLSCP